MIYAPHPVAIWINAYTAVWLVLRIITVDMFFKYTSQLSLGPLCCLTVLVALSTVIMLRIKWKKRSKPSGTVPSNPIHSFGLLKIGPLTLTLALILPILVVSTDSLIRLIDRDYLPGIRDYYEAILLVIIVVMTYFYFRYIRPKIRS